MERESSRLCESSNHLIEDILEEKVEYQGIKRILVFKGVEVNDSIAWEFDIFLTEERNVCSFEEAKSGENSVHFLL